MSSILKVIKKDEQAVEPNRQFISPVAASTRHSGNRYLCPIVSGAVLGLLLVLAFVFGTQHTGEQLAETTLAVNIIATTQPMPVVSEKPAIQTTVTENTNVAATSVLEQYAPLPPEYRLVVTEVFYQESQGESMAIINDLPEMEGTVIDGAVVQKIEPDRVEFLIGGVSYSILAQQ
ncbi:MAG: hypothetical protein OET90_11935 [Desulfuromonadales bacterium]|nr:hypothetical protein [Desulfuromonadales bacterium]